MKTVYTITTALPRGVSREIVIDMLHDHAKMIELNPLVIEHHKTRPPKDAPPDEFHCIWYQVTDKMSYLPGVSGKLSFNVCFHDIPLGVQTHVYAPMGLHIQEKWSVGGNLPGEPREPRELGISAPRDVLYIREDVNIDCNRMVTGFVKSKLNKAHATLVDRLLKKGEILEDFNYQTAMSDTMSNSDTSSIHHQNMSGLPTLSHGSQRLSNTYRMSGMSAFDSKGMPSPPINGQRPPVEAGYQGYDPASYSNSEKSPNLYEQPQQSPKNFVAELPGNPAPQPAELYSPGQPPLGGMTYGSPAPQR